MSHSLSLQLARPLILGASMSADFAAESPGKRLALRYTAPTEIHVHAKGGRTGAETIATLPSSALEGRTCIIGLDLFFWDSGLPNPRASLEALKKLLSYARALAAPLVLGDVPEILRGLQPSRPVLNREIHAASELDGVRTLPFDAMFSELLRTGSLDIGGRRMGWREIAHDGLHIGTLASDFLANKMAELLSRGK